MFELQFVNIAMIPIVVLLIACGLVGLAVFWRRGKTAEAISLLNTFLILLAILLILFPPP